jgi:uncharacterized membrane protein YhiD involved in acid resistance
MDAGLLAQTQPPATDTLVTALPEPGTSARDQLWNAGVRVSLAAALGTLLALRPRRRGTPLRSMPVIETQIILASVGALIMLVVGTSLARAFGIVGAANLIRYRAKIDDPKDAVVMLAALAVGLACGVGLYVIAGVGTLLVGIFLWTIESFEPKATQPFELRIKVKKGAVELRPALERTLRLHRASFELRASGDDEVHYMVQLPQDLKTDRITAALMALAPADDDLSVEWEEKKPKNK